MEAEDITMMVSTKENHMMNMMKQRISITKQYHNMILGSTLNIVSDILRSRGNSPGFEVENKKIK